MSLQKIAEDHVDWLLGVMREPMIQEFLHGYKHGYDDAKKGHKPEPPEHYGDFEKRINFDPR